MLSVKTFCCNPFQVNMYLIYDEQGHAVIVDPSCYDTSDYNALTLFVKQNNLTIQAQWLTHAHIDHICGSSWILDTFNAPLIMHPKSDFFLKAAPDYASMFGFNTDGFAEASENFNEQNTFIGQEKVQVLETPGHAAGSVCFYSLSGKFVITGDVLFHQSIGRTDLPTGNYQTLISSIETKLLTLPDETIVYPGHGMPSTIKNERNHNPFLIRH